MMNGQRGLLGLSKVAITTLFLLTFLIPGRGSFAATEIKYRYGWLPDGLYVPFTVGLEKGWYKEVGIEFVPQIGGGGHLAAKVVAAGDSQLGDGDASAVVIGVSRGLPITAIAHIYQETPISIMTLGSSGINDPRDIVGKKMGDAPESTTYAMALAALRNAGVDSKEFRFVAMAPAAKEVALLEKRVDVINGYMNTQAVKLRTQGHDIRVIRLSKFGLKVPGQAIFVSNDFLTKNEGLVKKWMEATVRANLWAKAHPEEAINLTMKRYKGLKREILRAQFDAYLSLVWTDDSKKNGFGWMSHEKWVNLQNFLLEAKMQKSPVADLHKLYSNRILEAVPNRK